MLATETLDINGNLDQNLSKSKVSSHLSKKKIGNKIQNVLMPK